MNASALRVELVGLGWGTTLARILVGRAGQAPENV